MGLDGTWVRSEAGNLWNVPMGSTKKVGESVRGGRDPEEYDSSPTLYSKALREKKKAQVQHPPDGQDREGRRWQWRNEYATSENADIRARSRSGRAPLP